MEQPTYHYARENPPCPVPSLDGYVIIESSDVPVPYHITSCGAGASTPHRAIRWRYRPPA